MKKPETPADEQSRLKTLQSLNILDTEAEERFDRLTRLARRMFGVPIALVSLVDENRQWFKSRAGLEASETPRDISFCGHAILGDEVFTVEDTANDERFVDNPLVVDNPNIRFYAGCPLSHADGSKLGTLCIIDTSPRMLTEDDVSALQDLAEMAERELAAVQLATVDELTGLSNRRGFVALAQKSLSICLRHDFPAALVFFDLNQFKPINDTFGHAEGDAALKTFAEHVMSTFRDSDVLGRLGGDEFAAFFANNSAERTKATVARLRASLDEYNRKADRGYDILFSDGIVTATSVEGQTIESMLAQADELMYEAKQRNPTSR